MCLIGGTLMLKFLFAGVNPTPGLPGEVYSLLILAVILVIFCFIVFIKSHFTDPLKKPKGIMLLAEMFVSKVDGLVEENMGRKFHWLAPYIGFLIAFIGGSFAIGIIGLPSPTLYFWTPFILAVITFFLINGTAIYFTKWRYLKRFIEPIPIFLPMNVISLISPILSLSLRLFANCLAGWLVMYLVYSLLESLSTMLFTMPFFIAPLITPFLHLYFDIFSGYIQTLVFTLLTMLLTANEAPEDMGVLEKTKMR